MATLKSIQALRAKQERDSQAHLRSVGYESSPFKAKYRGGRCGLCATTIYLDAEVAYFAGALSHVVCIDKAIRERDACKTCKGTYLVRSYSGIIDCPDCN